MFIHVIKMSEFKPKPNRSHKEPNWRGNLSIKIKELEVGDTFYTYDQCKNHIIGFVNDGDVKLVVYKCWLKHKGYWGYCCKEIEHVLYEICGLYNLSEEKAKKLFETNNANPEGWV